MAESYSVKAILSAADRGFTSAMDAAGRSANNLKTTLSGGFAFGVMAGAGRSAFNAITSSVTGLVSELNSSSAAWKTFEGNMSMLGKPADEIKKVKGELQDFATKTIYSASDMATTYSQLAAVGIGSTDQLVKGFGGLAAAAENPQQAMKTLSQQAVQMAAKPTVAWADFKLMLEQTPAGISAVAKSMGKTTKQLVQEVQDGTVETQKFFDAITEVGTNDAFTKLATEYKTVDQAMDGLTETVSNKLSPAFEVMSERGIKAISKLVDSLGDIDGEALAKKLSSFMDKAGKYWDIIKSNATEVKGAFGDAFGEIGNSLSEISNAFGSTESIENFSDVIEVAKNALVGFADFLKEHADMAAVLIKNFPKLFLTYKGFKILKSVTPLVSGFGSALKTLGGKAVSKIAPQLFKTSKGQKAVGKASASTSASVSGAGSAFLKMATGVLMVGVAFGILGKTSVELADSGGAAIAVMFGMTAAMVGLGFGMGMLLKMLAPMGAQLVPVSTAFLAMSAAVLIVSASFALLALSAIAVTNAGAPAIAVMFGLIVAVAALMAVAAALAPALSAGAVGFVAFGAALVMVGLGALLASAALAVVAAVLPTVVAYGSEGAAAIALLGASMLAFAVGAAVAGATTLVLSVGLAVVAVAVLLAAAGMVVLAAGVMVLAAGLTLITANILILGTGFNSAAQGALLCAAGFAALMAVAAGTAASLMLLSASFLLLLAGSVGATASIIAFGVGMLAACVGVVAMSAALKSVKSSMKTISTSAKQTESSLKSMTSAVKVVESGLNALGSRAKSAMRDILNAFDSTASKAKIAGKKIGTGFTEGLQGGLSTAPSIALTSVTAVTSALMSGRGSAYAAGAYISQGFAQGMLSCLGIIRSAAAQMAAAADAAVRAKAKIHSPSRVSAKLGEYWGEGWVNGITGMIKNARKASEELISIPSVPNPPTPSLAGISGGDWELSNDYSYTKNAKYTIVVPVNIDGKETARVTAPYTEAQLNKREKLNKMINGIR